MKAYDTHHSILRLIENMDEGNKQPFRLLLDCGDDDGLSVESAMAHIAMKEKGFMHEFRIGDGKHNWTYWHASLPGVLEFITGEFRR